MFILGCVKTFRKKKHHHKQKKNQVTFEDNQYRIKVGVSKDQGPFLCVCVFCFVLIFEYKINTRHQFWPIGHGML